MSTVNTDVEMDEEMCFVCTQTIVEKCNFLSQSQENSDMLCQILKIPHLRMNDNKNLKFSFEKINYCFSCVDRIRTVHDMLTEIERLEKQISEETRYIELQLKVISDTYDSKLERNRNTEQNNSSLQFRAAILNELSPIKSADVLENTQSKNIHQKFISGRREKTVENKNSLSLSSFSNMNPTHSVDFIDQPINKNEDNHNKCLVDCFVNEPVIKLEVTGSLSCESPYPADNWFDDDEGLFEDLTSTVNSSTLHNNIEDTTIGEEQSIFKKVDVPKDIRRKANSSKIRKGPASSSRTKTQTQTFRSYIPEELHDNFPRTLRPRTSKKYYEKSLTSKTNDIKIPRRVLNKLRKKDSNPYICQHCDKTFKSSVHAKTHERLIHTGENPYTCKYCKKTFPSLRKFRRHKATHTSEEKGFNCKNCELICKNRTDLIKHERIVHKIVERKFMCGQCGKTYLDKGSLHSHERTHTGEKPFMCQFCPKNFAKKKTLTIHELTHTGEKPFKCIYCEKCFICSNNLKTHERAVHTKVTPYKCQYCGKLFTSGSNAKRHELTHTQERTHECRCCGKTFPTTTDVKVHMRTHPGEKPYKCQYCELQFSYYSSVKDHVNSIHAAEMALTSSRKNIFC